MNPRLQTGAIALVAVAGTLWLGWRMLTMYSQPSGETREVGRVQRFLEAALAGDSAAVDKLSGSAEVVRWAVAAVAQDSVAIREWTMTGGRVDRRGDTVWVVMRRGSRTPQCSFMSSLTAALVEERIVRLAATCPEVDGQTE